MMVFVFPLILLCAGVHSQHAATYNINSDGTSSIGGKLGLAGNDQNALSALFSKSSTGAVSRGLTLDNVNGHGLTVSHTNIPNFGSQLTGAGKLNLLHNSNHNLDANAFATRNMPNIPQVPNFNTYGGNLDYMYKNQVGASLGAARTPFLQRTDYSAMGKVNLFQSPSSSVDLNAGFSRSVTPQFTSKWQPSGGLSFTRFFNG